MDKNNKKAQMLRSEVLLTLMRYDEAEKAIGDELKASMDGKEQLQKIESAKKEHFRQEKQLYKKMINTGLKGKKSPAEKEKWTGAAKDDNEGVKEEVNGVNEEKKAVELNGDDQTAVD